MLIVRRARKWFEFDYSREGPEQCCGKSEKESVSEQGRTDQTTEVLLGIT